MRYILSIFSIVIIFLACKKDKFTTVPQISFKSIKPNAFLSSTTDRTAAPILTITVTDADFEEVALELFRYQYQNNEVYQQYCNSLHLVADEVYSLEKIPFLPIQFFKSHQIKTTAFDDGVIFESSGTSSAITSRHFVKDINIYKKSFIK